VFTVALTVPPVVLLPYFVHGFGVYQGTPHPDAWSYTVFSAYLWDYPRLTDGGLAPVYQWASHLSLTRYVSPAEMGWLATATQEGDTQAAYGLLLTTQHVHHRDRVRRLRACVGSAESAARAGSGSCWSRQLDRQRCHGE
jgi:hypothetical protein